MERSYVEMTSLGGYRITGTRVSLDSVVHAWWEGKSAEGINADFPSMTLEQIHGAIAFYLSNRELIDQYLTKQDAQWAQFQSDSILRMESLAWKMREQDGVFSSADRNRMHELAQRNQNRELTSIDEATLASYRRLGIQLDILRAKARLAINSQ